MTHSNTVKKYSKRRFYWFQAGKLTQSKYVIWNEMLINMFLCIKFFFVK